MRPAGFVNFRRRGKAFFSRGGVGQGSLFFRGAGRCEHPCCTSICDGIILTIITTILSYVTLTTDSGVKGFGLAFTLGRGNEIICHCVDSLRFLVIGVRWAAG